MNEYTGLATYIKYLAENLNLQIFIKDFSGFLFMDPKLAAVLQPYMIHNNPYCMYVKSRKNAWDRCLHMQKEVLLKTEKIRKPFLGMCYAGMEEYVFPVICDRRIIGAICIGMFSSHRDKSMCRILKVSKDYNHDFKNLTDNFNLSVQNDCLDFNHLSALIGVISEQLSLVYQKLVLLQGKMDLNETPNGSMEQYLLSHVLEYISQYYHIPLTVKDLAGLCHCSESYISHIFKKNMKVTVKTWINQIRVEQAKKLLLNSRASISEIAADVGFNDPNYFSSVFSRICDMAPTDYKKHLNGHKNDNLLK